MTTALLGKLVRFEGVNIATVVGDKAYAFMYGTIEARVYGVSDSWLLLVQPLWHPAVGVKNLISLAGAPMVHIEAIHCSVQAIEVVPEVASSYRAGVPSE